MIDWNDCTPLTREEFDGFISAAIPFLKDREYLAQLCDARDKLCGFCEVNECEKCIVTNLINDAFNELDEDEDE